MTGLRDGWQHDVRALHSMCLALSIEAEYAFDLTTEVTYYFYFTCNKAYAVSKTILTI